MGKECTLAVLYIRFTLNGNSINLFFSPDFFRERDGEFFLKNIHATS